MGIQRVGISSSEIINVINRTTAPNVIVYIASGTVYAILLSNNTILDSGVAGTDDARVIQSGVNGLTGGRTTKEKILVKGRFTINNVINLPSYTIFEIQGTITLASGIAKDMLNNSDTVGGNNDIIITGGEIVGNNFNATPNSGIYFGRVTDCAVYNCKVTNCGHVGIYFKGSHRCYIGQNFVKNCGDSTNTLVGLGIAFLGGQYNAILNNICQNNNVGGSLMDGIHIESDDQYSQGPFNDSIIAENRCIGNGGAGFSLANPNRIIIANNTSNSNKKQGIIVANGAYLNICNNVCALDGQGTNITYNEMDIKANRCIIANNQIYGTTSTPRALNGILIPDDVAQTHDNLIMNNYIEEMYNASIVVFRGNHMIMNNKCIQSVGRCIRLDTTATACVVQGNNVSGGLLIEDVSGASNHKIMRNTGYVTEANILSGTFALDGATGVRTITIAHGLNITPNIQDCEISLASVTDDTATMKPPYVSATDGTNVTIKCNVTGAGGAGSTAKIALKVGRQ